MSNFSDLVSDWALRHDDTLCTRLCPHANEEVRSLLTSVITIPVDDITGLVPVRVGLPQHELPMVNIPSRMSH